MSTIILGIESSCDDTSAAVIKNTHLLSNVIANQDVHKNFGGVVPELASRAHQQNIIPVIERALQKANINKKQLDAIAFTRGPGLLGSLLVGTSFAKSFALGLNIPLIEIDHLQAHILAHFIDGANNQGKAPEFPFLCLTVSGGHTQIVLVRDHFDMEIIGSTIDDAAGEAFDKAAKILGLPYPGGPLIDKYAKEGNPLTFKFPEPNIPDLNYNGPDSFTYTVEDDDGATSNIATVDIAVGNDPPNKPDRPSGPTRGKAGVVYTYETSTTDPNNDQIWYNFSWGDGNFSEWVGPFASGEQAEADYSWDEQGVYEVKVKAKDTFDEESDWSEPFAITMPKDKALFFTLLDILEQFFPNLVSFLRGL